MQKLVFFFHHVSLQDLNSGVGFDNKYLYSLSHLSGPLGRKIEIKVIKRISIALEFLKPNSGTAWLRKRNSISLI